MSAGNPMTHDEATALTATDLRADELEDFSQAILDIGNAMADEPNSRGPLVEADYWTPKCVGCTPATETAA
jgi:hypothetical protein